MSQSVKCFQFNVFHVNIRCCSRNFDSLVCYLKECNIDYNVLVFTETWLNENSESLFEIPGFQNISINRNDNRRGGGI